MSRPTTSSTAAARAKPAARRNALPGRLSPGMACDTAFRIIARRHLDAVLAQHDGTCRGDPDALHQIRIALTHLRTAIRFFSPMVDDTHRPHVWAELKWLNGQLGMVQSTAGMFGIFAGFGMGLTANKHVAELKIKDPARAGRIIGLSSLVSWTTGGFGSSRTKSSRRSARGEDRPRPGSRRAWPRSKRRWPACSAGP